MTSWFLCIAILLFSAYLMVAVLLYYYQRAIIYHPVVTLQGPADFGLSGFSEVRIITEDKVNIALWHHPAPAQGAPLLIYFHGNTGHLGDRARKLGLLAGGMGVLALHYRGFGASEGSPTEQGLYNDARAAITYAVEVLRVPLERIFLYGESLGTGVATQMGVEFALGGIILEAPFLSVTQRGKERYPYIPVEWLLKDKFDSLSKIRKITSPLLLFHGELDQTTPVSHGRALFTAANQPKQAHFFPGIGHTDFDLEEISKLSYEFIRGR